MTEFFQLISNFGFPIVVAVFLLLRFEDKVEKLDKSITNLEITLKDLINKVDGLKRR